MPEPCLLCAGAMPEGEWCRACGYGRPGGDSEPVTTEPMDPLRVAVRDAMGGFLSTDGERERESYRLAKAAADDRKGAGDA